MGSQREKERVFLGEGVTGATLVGDGLKLFWVFDSCVVGGKDNGRQERIKKSSKQEETEKAWMG